MKNKTWLSVARLTMAVVFISCSTTKLLAQEKDPTMPDDPGLMMTTDLALARPVGAAATVTGFALFLVSSPFSLIGGNAGEAWDSLVTAPATYTFKRPLGHFETPERQEPPIQPGPVSR